MKEQITKGNDTTVASNSELVDVTPEIRGGILNRKIDNRTKIEPEKIGSTRLIVLRNIILTIQFSVLSFL